MRAARVRAFKSVDGWTLRVQSTAIVLIGTEFRREGEAQITFEEVAHVGNHLKRPPRGQRKYLYNVIKKSCITHEDHFFSSARGLKSGQKVDPLLRLFRVSEREFEILENESCQRAFKKMLLPFQSKTETVTTAFEADETEAMSNFLLLLHHWDCWRVPAHLARYPARYILLAQAFHGATHLFFSEPKLEVYHPLEYPTGNKAARCGLWWLGFYGARGMDFLTCPKSLYEEIKWHLAENCSRGFKLSKRVETDIADWIANKTNPADPEFWIECVKKKKEWPFVHFILPNHIQREHIRSPDCWEAFQDKPARMLTRWQAAPCPRPQWRVRKKDLEEENLEWRDANFKNPFFPLPRPPKKSLAPTTKPSRRLKLHKTGYKPRRLQPIRETNLPETMASDQLRAEAEPLERTGSKIPIAIDSNGRPLGRGLSRSQPALCQAEVQRAVKLSDIF